MTRILIINAYSPFNIGDGAIIRQMHREALRVFGADCEIAISATDPEGFSELYGMTTCSRLIEWRPLGSWRKRLAWALSCLPVVVSISWNLRPGRPGIERLARSSRLPTGTREALGAFLWADMIMSAGGGYLGDNYLKQLPFWHLQYLVAKALGLPVVFFSQSIGPADDALTRLLLRRTLRHVDLFCSRDASTASVARELGARRVLEAADVAFLTEPHCTSTVSEESVLGVSLLRWTGYKGDGDRMHERYLEAVAEAVEAVHRLQPDLRVKIFSTNRMTPLNSYDDEGEASLMAARLAARSVDAEAVGWTAEPSLFVERVAECELFVASRMHSAILAACAGVPVVGIGYEPKMQGLAELLGLPDAVQIERPDRLKEVVVHAWVQRASMRQHLVSEMESVREKARTAMDACAELA